MHPDRIELDCDVRPLPRPSLESCDLNDPNVWCARNHNAMLLLALNDMARYYHKQGIYVPE